MFSMVSPSSINSKCLKRDYTKETAFFQAYVTCLSKVTMEGDRSHLDQVYLNTNFYVHPPDLSI